MSGDHAGGHTVLGYTPFVPADYLAEYYSNTQYENDEIMAFFAAAARWIGPQQSMLEYSGGPTVYQLISLAPLIESLQFTDYLAVNLEAVTAWVDLRPEAHDWSAFVECALRHEGRPDAGDPVATAQREAIVRSRLQQLGTVDLFSPSMDSVAGRTFDVVGANFVTESVAVTHDEWLEAMRTVTSYVNDHGFLVMSSILNAVYWVTGGYCFDCLPVTSTMVRDAVESLGFEVLIQQDATVRQPDPTQPDYEGYDGMTFVLARRRNTAT